MKPFEKSWAANVVFDTTDATKPVALANVEQSFTTALLNSVTSAFTGGDRVSTGLGHTAGEVVKMYAGAVVVKGIETTFNKNLVPFI